MQLTNASRVQLIKAACLKEDVGNGVVFLARVPVYERGLLPGRCPWISDSILTFLVAYSLHVQVRCGHEQS